MQGQGEAVCNSVPAVLLRLSLTTDICQTRWRLQNHGGVSLESDFQRFCMVLLIDIDHLQPDWA